MKLILSKISYHKSTSVEEHKRSDEREIIIQKKSFQLVKRGPQKVSILTILPRSWSIQRIQMEFSKTSKKKKLLNEQGILSTKYTKMLIPRNN